MLNKITKRDIMLIRRSNKNAYVKNEYSKITSYI